MPKIDGGGDACHASLDGSEGGRGARVTKLIHVNSHVIRRNARTGDREPPIAVRRTRGGKPTRTTEHLIRDADGNVVAAVVYTPDRPLKCGAVVYVECYC